MNKEKFLSLWGEFLTRVKGKMMTQANKQTLSYPLARLLLTDELGAWFSDYEASGRWLSTFAKEHPEQAEQVKAVIKGIHFDELKAVRNAPEYLQYAVPLAGALAGYGIARYFGAGIVTQIASTALPAVLLYPAVKTVMGNKDTNAVQTLINQYIAQLDTYKQQILGLLPD